MVCSGRKRAPLVEGPVRADAQRAAFVGGGKPEQQLGAGVVEWGEAYFVDDDQVVTEQVVDDPADRVVGHAAEEGLDEVGGGEVALLVAGADGGDAGADPAAGSAVSPIVVSLIGGCLLLEKPESLTSPKLDR